MTNRHRPTHYPKRKGLKLDEFKNKIRTLFKRTIDVEWLKERDEERKYRWHESDKKISMIVCVDCENGIGKNGTIPWKHKEDMKRFKQLTKGDTVIMGRKTWESLPRQPLPGRQNIVVSRDPNVGYPSLREAMYNANHDIFIIGGSKLYNEVMKDGLVEEIYMTKLFVSYDCDVFINQVPLDKYKIISKESDESSTFMIFKKI